MPMTPILRWFLLLAFFFMGAAGFGQRPPPHLADYAADLRLPNGRVDTDLMVRRLDDLHVTTSYWLIMSAATDWDDLKLFLPKAAKAHLQVWVYLVPPSESAPIEGTLYPEPFRLDYQRWAEEIAKLSLQHPNLTGWAIDDFYQNHALFTPAYVGEMRRRSRSVNPKLTFFSLMYFPEIDRKFVDDYRGVIDGVVVAYPRDRIDIDRAWAILNDAALANPGELSFPGETTSRPGDFVMVSHSARVLPGASHWLTFRQRDNSYHGPTAGCHFKQALIDGAVVWEEDVAGCTESWQDVAVNVGPYVAGKTNVTVAFRLFDKKGAGNYGIRCEFARLESQGLQIGAGFLQPAAWQVSRQGAFDAGFGSRIKNAGHQFHVPFIVATAAQPNEFRSRHGDPASPERIASWLRMSLQAWKEGKCDGVVTCRLDKSSASPVFPLAEKLFRDFR
jgi:hypothetical protein